MSRAKKSIDTPLSARAQQFVLAYLIEPNATTAAEKAGYSAKTAASQGQRLLTDSRVVTAIALERAKRAQRARVKGDRIVQELERLGLYDIGDVFDFTGDVPVLKPAHQIPEDARRAIVGIKYDRVGRPIVMMADKGANLVTLMRHHGLLIDRVKVEDDVSEDELEARIVAALRTAAARKKAGIKPDPAS